MSAEESELRIRREIRALGWPLGAAASATVGVFVATKPWSVAIYLAFAGMCLIRWQLARPDLPEDADTMLATLRQFPKLFVFAAFSASTLAIGSITALLHPDYWWAWPLLGVGLLSTAALIVVIIVGRRNYERARTEA